MKLKSNGQHVEYLLANVLVPIDYCKNAQEVEHRIYEAMEEADWVICGAKCDGSDKEIALEAYSAEDILDKEE